MVTRHIALSASISIIRDILRISAQNPRETWLQTTQDKILHKLLGVLHKAVLAVK